MAKAKAEAEAIAAKAQAEVAAAKAAAEIAVAKAEAERAAAQAAFEEEAAQALREAEREIDAARCAILQTAQDALDAAVLELRDAMDAADALRQGRSLGGGHLAQCPFCNRALSCHAREERARYVGRQQS